MQRETDDTEMEFDSDDQEDVGFEGGKGREAAERDAERAGSLPARGKGRRARAQGGGQRNNQTGRTGQRTGSRAAKRNTTSRRPRQASGQRGAGRGSQRQQSRRSAR